MPALKKTAKTTDSVSSSLREGQSNVYYEKSVTKNMGNYESAKITVGVTLPISPTDEEVSLIKKTLEIGDKIVTEELEIQLKELIDDK